MSVHADRVIELFADVTCPFTHVGLRRLVEHRDELGRDDVVFRARAWPLELVNGEPLAADFVGTEIEALRASVAPDLFQGFDVNTFPSTTIPALGLVMAASRVNDRLGEHVSLTLRNAVFEEGRDIGDPAELTAIATQVGLGMPGLDAEPAVRAEWHEGEQRGVLGSPHFFVDHQDFFCPTLDITHVEGELQVAIDLSAFTAFVAAVFNDRAEPR